jgi:hypothetical protein
LVKEFLRAGSLLVVVLFFVDVDEVLRADEDVVCFFNGMANKNFYVFLYSKPSFTRAIFYSSISSKILNEFEINLYSL